MKPFKTALKSAMKRDGHSVAELASWMKVGKNVVYFWLNGDRYPWKKHRKKLALAYPELETYVDIVRSEIDDLETFRLRRCSKCGQTLPRIQDS